MAADYEQAVPTLQAQLVHSRTGPYVQNGSMKEFSDRLRDRMGHLGLSQAEVARRLGIGQRRFGQYLTPRVGTGKISQPDYHMLIRICDVLGTHPNYLLGVSDEPERPVESNNSARLNMLERTVASLRDKLNRM